MSVPERTARSLGAALRDAVGGQSEMERLLALGRSPIPPDEDVVELVCPRCHGIGWLRYDVSPGVPEFGRIIECRCGIVVGRRAAALWGKSMIPAEYADLGFSTYPDQAIARDVRDWLHGGMYPWLLLIGDFGVGKTGLAIALIKQAITEGRSAVFRVTPELLSEIRATYGRGAGPSELDLVTALKGVDLLALDDLGAERMTDWVEEKLFEILNHRYNERRRTVITTNLGPDELTDHVGERIFWRIKGMGWRYEIVGRNLRIPR